MFTKKASLYFGLAIAVMTLGLLLADWQLASMTLPIASIFFLANFWGLPEEIELKISHVVFPEESFGDEDMTVKIAISSNSEAVLENVEINDRLPAGFKLKAGSNQLLTRLRPEESQEHDVIIESPARGHYTVGPLVVRVQDPIGLYLVEKKTEPIVVTVMPGPERIKATVLHPRHLGPWPGNIPARIPGSGTEFYSVRSYVSGDEPKRINWKNSARHGRLMVNEMEAERVTDVMIVLDTDVAFYESAEPELFEREVRAAASVASLLLRNGNRVGVLLQGEERGVVPPAFGKRHERNILFLLAGARPGRSVLPTSYVITLLARLLLPAKAQLVIISPLLDHAMADGVRKLAALGYSILVLSTTPKIQGRFTSEHEEIAYRMLMLQRSNVLIAIEKICEVAEWPDGVPLSTVLREVRPLRLMAKA